MVKVLSKTGDHLGIGHFQDGSIRVRLFAFDNRSIDADFWKDRLQNAWSYRESLGLPQSEQTNAFRLVHAEGDGLPGLIIDIYGETAVLQCHSIGMYFQRQVLAESLLKLPSTKLTAVFCKSRQTVPDRFRKEVQDEYLIGSPAAYPVLENGHRFAVNWEKGQKTGFFLDQRNNRQLLAHYARGKKILNAFCYTGGFTIYALKAGATQVDSVDISAEAMNGVKYNLNLNFPDQLPPHQAFTDDVLKFLSHSTASYDIAVVDPPAFAKSRNKRHNAVMAYKRLNALAINRVVPGGLLFTFSCSQVVDEPLFYNTIVAAVIESGRQARVMHRLGQPADHPVSIAHPEGNYLKGLVLQLS